MISRPRGSVTMPRVPRGLGNLMKWSREVNQCLQQLRDRVVVTRGGGGGGASISARIPFKLSVEYDTDAEEWRWKVSQIMSSVQDGTNGDAIDLGPSGVDWAASAVKFDIPTAISATKYIVLEGDVDSSLVITNWTLAAVEDTDADEVGTDSGPPVTQNKIRLLIGKVTVDTTPEPDSYTASQAVFSSQRITHGLMNGIAVKVFESAPLQKVNI